MSCGNCALQTKTNACSKSPKSCGCNRKSVFNWLADLPEPAYQSIIPLEVSFKQGARKEFYQCLTNFGTTTGDYVVVETEEGGYDIGRITLSGELVLFQMKKNKRQKKLPELPKVIRKANEEDILQIKTNRQKEKQALIQARVIARKLNLEMKIGDIEIQGNGKKITFYYTAEGRVDFRQLIKEYAKEFRMRIEMRQIGMRQESARIGGVGACGRELCCSTWISEFKSVNTTAARYQNLSINQSKLTGQCGRLKCCLNYELDNYLEAWKQIPKKVDRITTERGVVYLQKTDILRRLLLYKYNDSDKLYWIHAKTVLELKRQNDEGEKIKSLSAYSVNEIEPVEVDSIDLVGQIELKPLVKRRSAKRSRTKSKSNRNQKHTKQKKNNKNDK